MGEGSTQQQKQLDEMLIAGRKIDAIKFYRELTGTGLAEAKQAVEAREAALRRQSPEAFARKPGCARVVPLAIVIVALCLYVIFYCWR